MAEIASQETEKQNGKEAVETQISAGSVASIHIPTKETVDSDETKTEQLEYVGYEEDHWFVGFSFLDLPPVLPYMLLLLQVAESSVLVKESAST